MNYDKAKAAIVAEAVVADGYFGATQRVGVAYDDQAGAAIIVAPFGCYQANAYRYPSLDSMMRALTDLPATHFPYMNNIKMIRPA